MKIVLKKAATWVLMGLGALITVEVLTHVCILGVCKVDVSAIVTTIDGKIPDNLSVAYFRHDLGRQRFEPVTSLVYSAGRVSFTVPMRCDFAGGVLAYLLADGCQPW